jgi:hypothetical protein
MYTLFHQYKRFFDEDIYDLEEYPIGEFSSITKAKKAASKDLNSRIVGPDRDEYFARIRWERGDEYDDDTLWVGFGVDHDEYYPDYFILRSVDVEFEGIE